MFKHQLKFYLAALAAVLMVINVAQAEWTAPTDNPPAANRERPLNVSSLLQSKNGALIINHSPSGAYSTDYALTIESGALRFGAPPADAPHVGFKAPANIKTSVIWTLPTKDGQPDYVLTTDGAGNLRFDNVANLDIVDNDWKYYPSSASFSAIYSEVLTRIGASHSTLNVASGPGDLYVQNRLEVDGLIYEQSATGNAEIQLKSGNNTHWGLYQETTNGDLRFWNTANLVTFTDNGRVGIGTDNPAQALDIAGGIKLTGLFYDAGNATGGNGQILSSNGTNIKWIDPTWFTGSGYIYSTVNTRIGSDGSTINYATGPNDLYVKGNLEVDGQFIISNLSLGFPSGSVIFHGPSGLTYDNTNFFWDNTSKHLGLGTASPTDFTLQVAGNVGPNVNNTYDLGSTSKRWANIFANNISVGGDLSLNLTQGSVLFYGASGISQNNANFFWNNTTNKLLLGSAGTAATLDLNGALNLAATTLDKSRGVLNLDGEPFMHNAAVSIWADPNTTTAYYSNTYLGRSAGSFPSAADEEFVFNNTGLGFWALKNNLGDSNTAIGAFSLSANNGGWGNSAVGSYALNSNVSGLYNSAFGYEALLNNTAGNDNAAFGSQALRNNTASGNAAFGSQALINNTAAGNAALGFKAGYANTSGAENLFLGYQAGAANNSGTKNIYLGYQAGYVNQAGTENVYLGHKVAFSNTSGSGNVMIGSGAGTNNNSGSGNIFIGAKAGYNESNSYRLYVEPSNADADNALLFGKFYSAGDPNPMLRVNGKLGIAPRGTTGFTPNKLVHIYAPAGDNAEIDLQSSATANSHWGIYQDRADNDLKFWQGSNRVILSDGGQVAIGGAIDSGRLLKVYGDLAANNYWSADNNQQGGSAYVCAMTSTSTAVRVRYEDGLYVCSCDAGASCPGSCTCTNP